MKKELYKEHDRGHKHHGWLDSKCTFSFGDYDSPRRMNFGPIRVLNDDIVMGGEGFGTRPHDNMEIVTIPLYGTLQYQDNMGNENIVRPGEVQAISAGTGITHSESNADREEDVNFLQVWIFPEVENVTPRYQQKRFDFEGNRNRLVEVVSPARRTDSLWIYQQAWISMGIFDKGKSIDYQMKQPGNGLFAMVVEGRFEVEGTLLDRRDAIGISEAERVKIVPQNDNARILLLEVLL